MACQHSTISAKPVAIATLLLCGTLNSAETAPIVMRGSSRSAQLLNEWYAAGTAAGNKGDYYDNRDRNHSRIDIADYPQLQLIVYSEKQLKTRTDFGLQRKLVPGVVVGNSSTSASVWAYGSNPRMLYATGKGGLEFLHQQYRNNNVYIYPEHHDHDSGNGGFPGHGDLYMANSPYLIISQGSSGSDRAFLHACFQTLAAFDPEVKKRLVLNKTLMPTLQAILRQSYQPVLTDSDYLSGLAHPTVFEGAQLDPVKMMTAAHNMTLDTLPPLVQLHLVDSDQQEHQHTYLDTDKSELLASTPGSIAFIHRRTANTMRVTISAEHSQDSQNRDLTYHWVVLRGDSSQIKIHERLGGAVAEIVVPYPIRRPISPDALIESNRIDIGVFVSVDGIYSPPAFITFFGLDNERRIYDRFGRLYSIAYNAQHQFNIPLPDDINRWHSLIRLFLFRNLSDHQRVQLLFPTLTPRLIKAIADIAPQLAEWHSEYNTLQSELKTTDEAAPASKKLKTQIAALKRDYAQHLNQPEAQTQRSYIQLISSALRQTAQNPDFYPTHQQAIAELLTHSKPEQQQDFEQALQSMLQFGYYEASISHRKEPDYQLPAHFPYQAAFANSRYLDFNATLITTAIAPGFLPRSTRTNCVDPRLTKAQARRDVFEYTDEGELQGWTRHTPEGLQKFVSSSYTDDNI